MPRTSTRRIPSDSRDVLQRRVRSRPRALDHRQFAIVEQLASGLHNCGQWRIRVGGQEVACANDGLIRDRELLEQRVQSLVPDDEHTVAEPCCRAATTD